MKYLDYVNIHSVNALYFIINKVDEYLEKIKPNSDDNVPLNEILRLHNLTIVFRFVFEEDNKNYPQMF